MSGQEGKLSEDKVGSTRADDEECIDDGGDIKAGLADESAWREHRARGGGGGSRV